MALTFGKTSDGASTSTSSADGKIVSAMTPAANGIITSLKCRLWLSSSGTCNWRGVLYSDVAGALTSASTLLANTADGSFTDTTEVEQSLNFVGSQRIAITASQQYWGGFHAQDPGTPSWTISRDATADGRKVNGDDVWTGGSATPWGADITSLSGPIDCYITYTKHKTYNGSGTATIKTVNGVSVYSIKTTNGID